MCLAVGVASIAFDLIVSVIETVKMFMIIKLSGHPVIKDVNEAINSEDPYDAMDHVTDNIRKDPDVLGGRMAAMILKQRLKKERSLPECIRIFEEMCSEHISGEKIIFECGPLKDEKDKYSLCLIRDYPVTGGRRCRVFMSLIYKLSDVNSQITKNVTDSDIDSDIYEYVRDSDIFKIADDDKMRDVRTGFELLEQ